MSAEPSASERPEKLWLSRVVRDYGQVLSALIIGCFSLGGAIGAAMIISSGVERGVERGLEGNEDIAVEVQGFNSSNSTDRQVIAHNYGEKVGILLPEVVIVVRDEQGKELHRITEQLNEGVKGYTMTEPFTLSGKRGMTYFLGRPDHLPTGAKYCVLEYRVKRSSLEMRIGESPRFECSG